MALDLCFRSGARELIVRFSTAEWNVLSEVARHLPSEVNVLAEVADFGEPVAVASDELRAAVDRVATFLSEKPELLPHTYQFKPEFIEQAGKRIEGFEFSTGGMSGFRLPGDDDHVYAIDAGLNVCLMRKMRIRDDGAGEFVGERDLRGEQEFETTNCGVVRIRKRRASTGLSKVFNEIRNFLSGIDEPDVMKVLG